MRSFEKWNNAYMIKMGMKNQELFDSFPVDAKLFELMDYLWNDVTHPTTDEQKFITALQ
jgi:hypothetical protein